jgi:hypothetical protein
MTAQSPAHCPCPSSGHMVRHRLTGAVLDRHYLPDAQQMPVRGLAGLGCQPVQ